MDINNHRSEVILNLFVLDFTNGSFRLSAGIMGHMQSLKKPHWKISLWLLLLVFVLLACEPDPTLTETVTQQKITPSVTSTPKPATPTMVPAAFLVNGEGVSLAWFESEVSRYLLAQENLGEPVEDQTTARDIVRKDIIDLVLLAQGAQAAGFSVSDTDVQARMDELAAEVDLPAWMAQWGYTEEDLFQSLKLQLQADYQKKQILDSIPEFAEQVELQQVFAYTETGASNALVSLNSGRDFDEVAFTYDPTTGGYLGWAPRGYLLIPALEEVAFSLPIGEYSEVIESEIGYHILLVLDRADRPLTSDARMTLQRSALHTWLDQQREQATIEVIVD